MMIKATHAILLALLTAGSAQAGIISNPGPSGGSYQVQYYSPSGQSFTAIDSQLTTVGFSFAAFNTQFALVPVTVTLLAGAGLGGSAIATRTIAPIASADGLVLSYADFSGTQLAVGASYTAILSTANPYWGVHRTGDAYSGGTAYLTAENGVVSGGDLVFEVNGVPEPGTWALLIAGFGLSGAAMRRRRAADAAA